MSNETPPTEVALFSALAGLEKQLDAAREKHDWAKAFAGIAAFAPTLHRYFEDVYVMVDDENVRNNRLRLMRAISERCSRIAHFQLLAGESRPLT